MVQIVAIGLVLGGLITLGLQRRSKRAGQREAQGREELAVIVMYAEMTAAIAALDLALRDGSFKWVASLSESRTLSEAWRDHGEALLGLGPERWQSLSEAVTAVAPGYGLSRVAADSETEALRGCLTERRGLLVEAARILSVLQAGGAPEGQNG